MPTPPIDTAEEAIHAARLAWKTFYVQSGNQAEFLSPETIAKSEPYTATLRDGVWTISGTPGAPGPITKVRVEDGKVMFAHVQDPQ
jgi:hypothetical protein